MVMGDGGEYITCPDTVGAFVGDKYRLAHHNNIQFPFMSFMSIMCCLMAACDP
jgi:hypothetical protein